MATGCGLRGARVQAGPADGRAGRRASRQPKSSHGSLVLSIIWWFWLGMLKSIFSDTRFSEAKIRFFSIIVYQLTWETGFDGRLVRLCIVNMLTFRWWSRLLLGLAILSSCVCSSSGAFLQQPLFGAYKLWHAEQSSEYRESTSVATTYKRWSVTARQSRHQKASRRRHATWWSSW